MRKKAEFGLTSEYGYGVRCDKCDTPLEWSEWNGKKIVYSTNSHMRMGFLCVKCAVNPAKRNAKPRVTIEDLDNYLTKLLRLD